MKATHHLVKGFCIQHTVHILHLCVTIELKLHPFLYSRLTFWRSNMTKHMIPEKQMTKVTTYFRKIFIALFGQTELMALGLRNILRQNPRTDSLHLKSEKWKACDTVKKKERKQKKQLVQENCKNWRKTFVDPKIMITWL